AVVGEVLADAQVVEPALRQQRAGDRRDREQEEQHERGAHRGQLTPGPPQPARDAEHRYGALGLLLHTAVAHRPTWKSLVQIWTSEASSPYSPVTMSTPTTTSRPPPSRITSA